MWSLLAVTWKNVLLDWVKSTPLQLILLHVIYFAYLFITGFNYFLISTAFYHSTVMARIETDYLPINFYKLDIPLCKTNIKCPVEMDEEVYFEYDANLNVNGNEWIANVSYCCQKLFL